MYRTRRFRGLILTLVYSTLTHTLPSLHPQSPPPQRVLNDNRGPGLLAVVWFGSSPTPFPHLVRQKAKTATQEDRERETTCMERGKRRSRIIRSQESLVLYKSSNTRCSPLSPFSINWNITTCILYSLLPLKFVKDRVRCRHRLVPIQFAPDTICADHKIRIWDRIARKTPKRRFSDITFEFRIRFCYSRGNIFITELLRSLGKCCTVLARVHGYRKKNTYTNKKIQWSWMYFKGIVAWDGFGPILSLFLSYLNRKCSTVTLFCTVQQWFFHPGIDA